MATSRKTKKSNTTPQRFEDVLVRLEEIVSSLEDGECALEDSLALFEEGIALSRTGMKQLNEAEQKIEHLLKTSDGRVETHTADDMALS